MKTDIKFKPRARKAPPEPVWNVADLWGLRLNMSIGKEFEFSLGTAKSAIAVRPIMLNSYDVELYLELCSSCSMITPRVCRPGLEVYD